MSVYRNKYGRGHIKAIICTILIIVGVAIIYFFVRNLVKDENVKTVDNIMVSIQIKVKNLGDKYIAKGKDATILVGSKVQEHLEDAKIKNLLDREVIKQDEENFDLYYYLTKAEVAGLIGEDNTKISNDEYMVVNYSTNEVIYTAGYVIDGKFYYKLSDIQVIEDEKEAQKEGTNLNKEENVEQTSNPEATQEATPNAAPETTPDAAPEATPETTEGEATAET